VRNCFSNIAVSRSGEVHRDDSQLIALSLRGDHAAFGVLVGRYQDRLYQTTYRLLGNAADAQDVVQDAFLSAYQSLHQFKGDARFFTWLYRIAVNSAISLRRRETRLAGRRAVVTGESDGRHQLERHDESDGSRPDTALERAEDERRLQAALDSLTVEHRAVLVLKEIEGRKYEAIAGILGVPVGTVRSRLHRARVELRDRLSGVDEMHGGE
jgi:RNA polymerase sigma-70 factor (ECF subfamily)